MIYCRLNSKLLLHRGAISTLYKEYSTFSKYWNMVLNEDKEPTPPYSHLVQIGKNPNITI